MRLIRGNRILMEIYPFVNLEEKNIIFHRSYKLDRFFLIFYY